MSEITGPVSEINYNGVAVPLSAGGGEKLYQHNITMTKGNEYYVTLTLYTNNNEIFKKQTLVTYLNENGIKDNVYTMCNGYNLTTTGNRIDNIFGITSILSMYDLNIKFIRTDFTINESSVVITKTANTSNFYPSTITDTVFEV